MLSCSKHCSCASTTDWFRERHWNVGGVCRNGAAAEGKGHCPWPASPLQYANTAQETLSRQAHQSSDEQMLALAFIETAQRIPVAFWDSCNFSQHFKNRSSTTWRWQITARASNTNQWIASQLAAVPLLEPSRINLLLQQSKLKTTAALCGQSWLGTISCMYGCVAMLPVGCIWERTVALLVSWLAIPKNTKAVIVLIGRLDWAAIHFIVNVVLSKLLIQSDLLAVASLRKTNRFGLTQRNRKGFWHPWTSGSFFKANYQA